MKEEKELWANESKSLTLEAVQSEKDALQKKLLMDYEERTRSLKNEHMEQINSLQRAITEKEREVYAKMDQKVSDLRQKYDVDREALLLKHEKAILKYNEKSSTTLLNSQQRWQDEIAKYNKMLREKEDLLKDAYNEKKEEIASLRQEFQQNKKHLLEQQEIKILNLETENATKLEAVSLRLKEKYLSDIADMEEKIKGEITKKHDNDVADIKSKWETERNDLSCAYDKKLREIIEQKNVMEEKMKTQLSNDNAISSRRIEAKNGNTNITEGFRQSKEELESQCDKKMQIALDSLAKSAKQDHEKHISSIVKEFEQKKSQLKEQYESQMSTEISRLLEDHELEKTKLRENLQENRSIEIENAVQVQIDKFNEFKTNMQLLQEEHKKNRIKRMSLSRAIRHKKLVLAAWKMHVKAVKILQLENKARTTHIATLESSNRNIKVGFLVLGNWMKKNDLSKKYNAMTKWRANCAKGHTTLMSKT